MKFSDVLCIYQTKLSVFPEIFNTSVHFSKQKIVKRMHCKKFPPSFSRCPINSLIFSDVTIYDERQYGLSKTTHGCLIDGRLE